MPPNILLVVLDAARAQNSQIYGYSADTTPFLSEFASEATLYTQARSPSTWSLPSHVSMFTGLEVPEHNVVSRSDSLNAGETIWADLAENHGYDTGVFSENPFITSDSWGIGPAFDDVVTGLSHRRYPFPGAVDPNTYTGKTGREDIAGYLRFALASGRPVRSTLNALVRRVEVSFPTLLPDRIGTTVGNKSAKYADAFLDWQADRERWAAVLNLTDVHHPYEPITAHDHWGGPDVQAIHDTLDDPRWDFYSGREPWWKRRALESLYDGCLHQSDATVRRILRTLSDRGELADTLVVVTADHGEGFGEPSRVRPGFRIAGHAGGIHECLVHVPLLVKYPEQETARTVESVATLTELPAVVSSVVDGESDPNEFVPDGPVVSVCDLDGQYHPFPKNFEEYRTELSEEQLSGRAIAVYRDHQNGAVRKFARWGDHAAVIDSFDAQNVIRRQVTDEVAEEITAVMEEYEEQYVRESSRPIDDATSERLQDLGYL
jgi:arylsulfatase